MRSSEAKWAVPDNFRLISAIAEKLAGSDGHISFEGSLSVFNLSGLPGASGGETTALKRNTIWPKQDFLVFPLEPAVVEAIFHRVGHRMPKRIIHVQIERNGILEFGAYDNFAPGDLVFGPSLTGSFVQSLVSEGILTTCPSARR